MTSMAQSCGAAFVASWTQSIIDLPTLFPNLQSSITRLCSLTTTTGGIGHHLSQALPPGKTLSGLLENPLKVQHNLTYNHVSEVVSQLLGSDQPSRTKARLRSLQGKGAGAWLETISSSSEFALKPCNYCIATRLRLGCPMPLSLQTGNPKCDCGKPIDQEGYHLLTCKTQSPRYGLSA